MYSSSLFTSGYQEKKIQGILKCGEKIQQFEGTEEASKWELSYQDF